MARRGVLRRLAGIEHGTLTLVEDGKGFTFGRPTDACALEAAVTVHNFRFYPALAFRGSLGAAEAYMMGDWSCDDLTSLIRILILNQRVLERIDTGLARVLTPLLRFTHWLRRNTRGGSRANIAAHYDLGNEFYALFLDATMTYSCAYFEREDATLEEASITKYDRLCRMLGLRSDDHVLEIGTGWGGFALHAATGYGCRVTTTTISREQHAYAKRRIEQAGLGERVNVLLEDYRDLRGQYDKLVSIEMIEAVGHQYLEQFFRVCADRLSPEGAMALQAITIADQLYRQHTRTVDFIKRYVFPGSCLTSVTSMCTAATGSTDLRAVRLDDITPHYSRTLRLWRERFLQHLGEVRAMGFPEPFVRMWDYYLCYCEAAFAERYIGDVQMVFAKPRWRDPAGRRLVTGPRASESGSG